MRELTGLPLGRRHRHSDNDTSLDRFQEAANLDEGNLWPSSYAVTKLTAADKKQLVALLKKAVS
jgi:hypothetical protein